MSPSRGTPLKPRRLPAQLSWPCIRCFDLLEDPWQGVYESTLERKEGENASGLMFPPQDPPLATPRMIEAEVIDPWPLLKLPPEEAGARRALKRLRSQFFKPWLHVGCGDTPRQVALQPALRIGLHIRRGDAFATARYEYAKEDAMSGAAKRIRIDRRKAGDMGFWVVLLNHLLEELQPGPGAVVVSAFTEVSHLPAAGRRELPELKGFELEPRPTVEPGSLPYYHGRLRSDMIELDPTSSRPRLRTSVKSAANVTVRFFLNTHPMATLRCMSLSDVLVGSHSHFTSIPTLLSPEESRTVVPPDFEFRRWCGDGGEQQQRMEWCQSRFVPTALECALRSEWSESEREARCARIAALLAPLIARLRLPADDAITRAATHAGSGSWVVPRLQSFPCEESIIERAIAWGMGLGLGVGIGLSIGASSHAARRLGSPSR